MTLQQIQGHISKVERMTIKLKIIVLVLLAFTFLLPFFSAQNFSPASDEITHLPSGYSYWKTGFIELNPQHPPLVKLIASFPLLFMDIKFDAKDPNLIGTLKDEWKFGANFLFSNDVDRLFFWGRMPVMLLSLLLGFFVFKWASEMFSVKAGPIPSRRGDRSYKAGILALFIYAFMPTIITNAQFVTTDLPVTAFSFITLYYLWKFFVPTLNDTRSDLGLIKVRPCVGKAKHLVFAGLFLGLALGSKFSAVLLLPIIVLLILIHFWLQKGNWEGKINQAIKWFLALSGLSLAVVYLTYLMPLDSSFYLRGLKSVYADWGKTYGFYLNGDFSSNGWWYYFLFAFLIKTPIPVLAAMGLSIIMYKKYKLAANDKLFIFIPLTVFFLIMSVKAGNIGIRYLLPVYPFFILYIGGLANIFQHKGRLLNNKTKLIMIFLGLWYIFSAAHIYPDYLAYFNESIGGPKNGYKYLDDSNIEWGQDLKRLAAYQKQHPDTKVIYSWTYSDPSYYGVKNVLPKEQESLLNPSGRYAVNIHFLVRLKELSQSLNEKNIDWLSLYQPVDKIGYSFFIFEF